MDRRWAKLLVALCALTLAACQTQSGGGEPAAGSAGAYRAEEGLAPRERLRKSIALLEKGEAEQARVELQAYKAAVPDSRVAEKLLWQIDADAVAHFGDRYFTYDLKKGDSLSRVAQDFLGDRLSFYILAKYNGLARPNQVTVGQTIKVPGVRKAAAAPATPAPKATKARDEAAGSGPKAPAADDTGSQAAATASAQSESAKAAAAAATVAAAEDAAAAAERAREARLKSLLVDAGERSAAGQHEAAITMLDEGLVEFSEDPRVKAAAATGYARYAEQLTAAADYEAAQSALQRAIQLSPSNSAAVEQRRDLERRMAAEQHYRTGLVAIQDDRPVAAHTELTKALALMPAHQDARNKLDGLTPEVVKAYHRKALIAYNNQDLDLAVSIWDSALQFDPNHTPSLLGRAKALELKQRLERLKDSD